MYFEDFAIGDTFESPGRTVTETDLVIFSGLSGDHNELHTDEEFMKKTQFGRRIAHGLLGLAIQSGLGARAQSAPTATIAFLGIKEWNFKAPIFIGDTIHLKMTVAELRRSQSGDRGILTWKRELINQRSELVQEGFTASLINARNPSAVATK